VSNNTTSARDTALDRRVRIGNDALAELGAIPPTLLADVLNAEKQIRRLASKSRAHRYAMAIYGSGLLSGIYGDLYDITKQPNQGPG
jgi:hypothetical protein